MSTPTLPARSGRQVLLQATMMGCGLAVLVVISVASLFLINRTREDANQVTQTLLMENDLSTLRNQVLRAESSQRGFLLTGDTDYLGAFDSSVAEMGPLLDQIRERLRGDTRRLAAAEQLTDLVRAKQDELRHTVLLKRSGNDAGALAVVRTDRGERLTRDISAIIATMQKTEQALLAERSETSSRSSFLLLIVNLVGVAALIIIAVIGLRLAQKTADALRRAHHEVEGANQILEQRVAERTADLQEANNEIQSFAYIVSHDLRAPLVNIMGFTSELEALRTDLFDRLADLRRRVGEEASDSDEDLDKDFSEAFGFIKASITKMDRLINAILDLSRQGRKEFAPAAINVTELMQAITATMAHQLMDREAKVSIAPLPSIISDRLALEQVFTNLIDNAVKYLRPEVPGLIEISARETPGYITYMIRDNGRGIDPNDRARVFELFRRSGPQDRPGEGIGLAHVRALVRRLGGGITLDSELGQGTVFKVTLPRKLVVDTHGGKNA
ncbi:multi-sensor signal transduction histidine kinase [Azorhizobium sp. AG788]|uniref:sensor histidine kinase n=1 Tax=Azorhizobium sp. AG788 TaxID=2183897 RepID=UPI00105C2662|nr:CHASE3 domain-containing protein [Azorhizobium sp. AG788]TDU01062.1 multi-sensor signal transduction histidine kinase [Azorhizobium sp. AG788]